MLRNLPILMLLFMLAACSGRQLKDTSSDGQSTTSDSPQSDLIHIRLPMGFVPDPQYAPFYVAVENGYFAEEGFNLEFDYSFETDGIALVGAGELPFAIVSGEQVVLARAQELPIVYVMEWFQKYPIAVISKAKANITSPQDLVGREIGVPLFFGASYVGFAGLLSANGLSLDQVSASEIGFTQVENLLTDQVEAVVGYANNEPLQLASLGEDVNVMYVADYADMVANGIITNETAIAENPEMVEAFVRAILRGLNDTLNDPDAAYEISKKYVEGLDDSRRNVLESSLDLWRADTLGLSESEAWALTQDILLELGFMDNKLDDLEKAYTNELVLAVQP
jgi:NitT/TauT family transport system substrate-binding protein